MTKQIIALGGGGFSQSPDNLTLDRYILQQTGVTRPRVAFVPTASGDSERYMLNFFRAFSTLECVPSTLHLFPMPPTRDLRTFVAQQDVIYVGGGSTRNLLVLWREWGLDQLFREAYERGTVLCGISAGMNCWFESCVTDSWSIDLDPLPCLGFLPGSACPHFDAEPKRRPRYRQMIERGELAAGYAADEGAALHFIDGTLHRVVSERPGARAYLCEMTSEGYRETEVRAE
jgi:dipeptidase E